MWQMAATVMVVVLLAYSRSVVYARALEDAPGEDGQDQKVTRVDDIDSRALELPWNIGKACTVIANHSNSSLI